MWQYKGKKYEIKDIILHKNKMWVDDENVKGIQEEDEIQGFRVGTGGLVWELREEFEACGMRLRPE